MGVMPHTEPGAASTLGADIGRPIKIHAAWRMPEVNHRTNPFQWGGTQAERLPTYLIQLFRSR